MEAATQALKRLCREMPHYSPQHLALMYQKQLEYDQQKMQFQTQDYGQNCGQYQEMNDIQSKEEYFY